MSDMSVVQMASWSENIQVRNTKMGIFCRTDDYDEQKKLLVVAKVRHCFKI